MKLWIALGLLLALAQAASAAHGNDAVARLEFMAGDEAYAAGDYKEAARRFKAAYTARPDPLILYNIAQAHRRAGELTQALFFYRSYRQHIHDRATIQEVDGHIAAIDRQLQGRRPEN